MKRKFLIAVLTTWLLIVSVCSANLKVTMLNVGQGDSLLIQTNEQNVLIDTSDTDERDKLRSELYRLGVFTIDKLILTHPHADHIGNAAYLLQNGVFSVRAVYDNGVVATSKLYQNYVAECKKRNVPIIGVRAGDTLDFGENAHFIVLHPFTNTFPLGTNLNDTSIVGRLEYGNFSMLFTGDAESAVEEKLLDTVQPVNVLKAGHHGSKTSSTRAFIRKIKPEYVLISAGQPTTKRGGNTYGHPHVQALENFLYSADKSHILWTHKNGAVTINSDGNTYSVTAQADTNWFDSYLLNSAGYSLSITKL